MSESLQQQEHIAEAALWQWQKQELEAAASAAVQRHLQACAVCQQRVHALRRMLNEMQAAHESAQPTLAAQMQLLRVLATQFAPPEKSRVFVSTCQSVVRWLAPAIAILAAVFVLWREETVAANNASLENLLSQTREEQLLLTSEETDAQQALMELAFSSAETQR